MPRLLSLVLVASACGSSSAPTTTTPSNTTSQPVVAEPPNELRKWGFPTDAECKAAVDTILKIVKTNAEKSQQMAAAGSDDEIRGDGERECRRKWLLAQLDCVHAAKTFDDLDKCMRADYTPPAGIDLTSSPGHASTAECDELAKLVTARKTITVHTPQELVEQCHREWSPSRRTCIRNAQTADDADDCGHETRKQVRP